MVLIGYWPLNETSGDTAYDRSGQNNHGTTNGGVTQGAQGILGTTAYSFDGVDDSVTAPSSELNPTPVTVSAWFYYESGGGSNPRITTMGNDSGGKTRSIVLYDSAGSGELTVEFEVGGGFYTVQGPNPTDEAWNHVAFVYDGKVAKLYLNGTNEAETAISGTIDSPTGDFKMGYWGNEDGFSGRIADVRVYDHALSAAEVQYLYQVSKSGSLKTSGRES